MMRKLAPASAGPAIAPIVEFGAYEALWLEQGATFKTHYYELVMASSWAKIADEQPESVNLILVDQIHASKRPVAQYPFAPAASHLRSGNVLSFRSEPVGGHAWNCQDDGCSVHVLSGDARKERYFARFPSEADGFDGSYSVGNRYSASEPAMQK